MQRVRLRKRTKGGVSFIGRRKTKRLRMSLLALGAAEAGARGQGGPMKNSLVKVRAGGQQRGEIHFAQVSLSGGHDGDNSRNSSTDEVAGDPTLWLPFLFFLNCFSSRKTLCFELCLQRITSKMKSPENAGHRAWKQWLVPVTASYEPC